LRLCAVLMIHRTCTLSKIIIHATTMIVSKFMTPASQVVSCYPSDTIGKALGVTLQNPLIGAVVVLHPSGNKHIPVGIVTTTDLLQAYQEGLDPDQHKLEEIMGRTVETIGENESREKAAEHFEKTKHHHAFVISHPDSQWVGLLTVWDVALEAAKEDRAWPWNRDAVEFIEKHHKHSPTTQRKVAKVPKQPDLPEPGSFLAIAGAYE